MNTIDHRILIENRSSAVVWEQISDISKNPAWQTDCAGVSFLSSRKNGVGTRWRYTSKNKREYVIETTAWYDGLGYEYTIVDGGSYRECRGRIRLQEIAEGTIVRWTFNYEMKGFMGGVRNALAHRRTLEKDMIDSLKSFWRYMNQVKSSSDDFEARSLMRDAPNYEARSHYKPRHPSAIHEDELLAAEDITSPAPVITEPPVQEEDTKPHGIPKETPKVSPVPTVSGDQPVIEVATPEPEPDFMRAIPEPVTAPPEDTAKSPKEQQEALAVVEELPAEEAPTPPEPLPLESTTPKAEPIPAKEPVLPDVTPRLTSLTDTLPDAKVQAVFSGESSKRTTERDFPRVDTSEVSVFELFGLQKPSETQEVRAVEVEPAGVRMQLTPEPPLLDPLAATVVEHPLRQGLRLLMRRAKVKLRRPS